MISDFRDVYNVYSLFYMAGSFGIICRIYYIFIMHNR